MLMRRGMNVGCTVQRHRELGAHAPINARAGEAWRNDNSIQDTEMMRDALYVRHSLPQRLRKSRFSSKWFNKHLDHLLDRFREGD